MTDGVWWFYLFWLPDYLIKQFNMTNRQVMMPTFLAYGIAIAGSIYGASIPMSLIKRGMPVYKARMTTMFIISLFPLAVISAQYFGDVARFGGPGCHPSRWHDLYRNDGTPGMVGESVHHSFGHVSEKNRRFRNWHWNGSGGIGGVVLQLVAGRLTDAFSNHPQTAYFIMFIICALSYQIAWAIMKALVPRHKPIIDL